MIFENQKQYKNASKISVLLTEMHFEQDNQSDARKM